MPSASVVGTFVEQGNVCLAVRVENDSDGQAVEYIGRVPLTPEFEGLTNAQKKAALVAAAKAVRDAQKAGPPAVPSITGSVTV